MRALWRNWHRILGTFLREEEGVMGSGQNHDGETVKITAGKDGLMFNGAAAKAA
jgi:hypothetical protein